MGLAEVSTILWRERNLLDLLAFKLEEEQLVLTAGLSRWLPRATGEVQLVLAELQLVEGCRAGALDIVAAELGLQPGRNLHEVAAAAPPPWDGLLERHRQAFLVAASEIGRLEAAAHRDLLGLRETEAVLAWLEEADATQRRDDDRLAHPARPALRLLPDDAGVAAPEVEPLSRPSPN